MLYIIMTSSALRRLNILFIKFKIIAFCIITLCGRLLVRVGILLTLKLKRVHDRIISLKRKVWVHKTRFYSATFYWSVCIKPGRWAVMYLCVSDIGCDSFYDFCKGVWNCSDSVVFFVFRLLIVLRRNFRFTILSYVETSGLQYFWLCFVIGYKYVDYW